MAYAEAVHEAADVGHGQGGQQGATVDGEVEPVEEGLPVSSLLREFLVELVRSKGYQVGLDPTRPCDSVMEQLTCSTDVHLKLRRLLIGYRAATTSFANRDYASSLHKWEAKRSVELHDQTLV